MPIIRLTQKLQKEMKLKPLDLAVIPAENPAPFTEWYAHLFILNRRKQLIFVETQTLFSFSFENVVCKDIRDHLQELFQKSLNRALHIEEVSEEGISRVMDISRGEITFAKTENRKTIGAMNEFIKQHKFSFSYQGHSVDERDRCNRYMLIHGFSDGSKDYKYPIDVFSKVLKDHWAIDFKPHKNVLFRKEEKDSPPT